MKINFLFQSSGVDIFFFKLFSIIFHYNFLRSVKTTPINLHINETGRKRKGQRDSELLISVFIDSVFPPIRLFQHTATEINQVYGRKIMIFQDITDTGGSICTYPVSSQSSEPYFI